MSKVETFIIANFLTEESRSYIVYIVVIVPSIWFVVEILFLCIVHFKLSPSLQRLKKAHPVHSKYLEAGRLTQRVLTLVETMKNYSLEKYLSLFFHGAPVDEIYCDNVKSFLAWVQHNKKLNKLTKSERSDVEQLFQELSSRYELFANLKPGFNPKAGHVAFTLEPVPYIHRPLFIYIAAGVFEFISSCFLLRARGFQLSYIRNLRYWIRHGDPEEGDPMLFMHGITPGWAMYMHFVEALAGNRTVILIDLDAIKLESLTFRMPIPNSFCVDVMDILHRHQIAKVSVVGHSFGSITSGWLVNRYPSVVSHLTLVDPVSLLLALPDVAFKFLYRTPKTFMEWVIYLLASQEITVSHALRRHFWWYNNVLWLEDLPANIGVVVGVSGNDDINNAAVIFEYVEICRKKRTAAAAIMKSSSFDSLCTSLKKRDSFRRSSSCSGFTPPLSSKCGGSTINYIEGVLWPEFFHGQILLGGKQLRDLAALILENERSCRSKL